MKAACGKLHTLPLVLCWCDSLYIECSFNLNPSERMDSVVMKRFFPLLLMLAFSISLAIPVSAQGQSPTTPVTTPGLGTNNSTNSNSSTSGSSSRPSRFDKKDKDKTTNKITEGETKAQDKKKDEKATAKSNTIKLPKIDMRIVGPGKGGKGAAAPAAGAAAAPAARKETGKPVGGAVKASVVGGGEKSSFQPVLRRELKYGEVPDEGDTISTASATMTVAEFLEIINAATQWNILATEEAQKATLQAWILDKKPKEALEVLKFRDIFYEWKPETKFLYVMTKNEWLKRTYGKAQSMEFIIKNADVNYIESVITSLISEEGRVITDPRTNHIYVWDTQDNLDQMKKTVATLDVPLEKTEFCVKHADLPDIESVLNSLLSPAAILSLTRAPPKSSYGIHPPYSPK